MLKLIGIGIKTDASIARKIVDGIAIIGIGILIVVGMVTTMNHIKRVGNEAKIETQIDLVCENNIIYMDGIAQGKTATVKWYTHPKGYDRNITLYCPGDSIDPQFLEFEWTPAK